MEGKSFSTALKVLTILPHSNTVSSSFAVTSLSVWSPIQNLLLGDSKSSVILSHSVMLAPWGVNPVLNTKQLNAYCSALMLYIFIWTHMSFYEQSKLPSSWALNGLQYYLITVIITLMKNASYWDI